MTAGSVTAFRVNRQRHQRKRTRHAELRRKIPGARSAPLSCFRKSSSEIAESTSRSDTKLSVFVLKTGLWSHMHEGEQGNGGNAEKRGRRDTPASGRRGGRAGRTCGPRRADGLPRAGGPQRVAWFLRAHGLHQADVAAHDGMSVFDLSPAASSARHPPQPTRRPKPPGDQTIRNPPYCPKVSRGNRSPASAFRPLAPIGRTPHLDTTSQSTPLNMASR